MKHFFLLLLLSSIASAASPGATYLEFSRNGVPTMVFEDQVTPTNSIGLPVSLVGGITLGSVSQGSGGSISSPWFTEGTDGTNHASYTAGNAENVNVTNSIVASNPSVSTTGAAVPTSATFIGVKNGSGNLIGLTDGQSTMSTSIPVAIASDQSGIPVTGTFWQTTQPISASSLPLPSGAATSANQTTANTSLSTIAANTGKGTLNATPSFATAAISAATTVTAPSNTVEVIVQALDTNTSNLRVAFGATASATNGIQLEPGRSETFHVNANASLCPESGTQTYNVQWIAQ